MTSEYKLVTVEEKSSKISIKSIVMRRSGVMYDLEHHQGYFYFKTNKRHENFEVIRVPVSSVISTELFDFKNDETTIIPGNQDFIEKIEMFQIGLVYWFRRNGMRKLGFVTLTPPFTSTILNQDSKVYSLTQDMTGDFDIRFYRTFNTTCLTFSNSSLLQPPALYSLDLSTMKTTILFQQTSPKHKPDYLEKTIYGETSDTHSPIPISITYKTTITFPAPLLILSYGAYGTFIDPSYNSEIFSLLDRHFIWVICHPRGDGDMGSKWYSTGKFDLKRHTFEDTNSCILKLIRDKFTNDGMIVLKGRSAGGLVAGNAIVSQGFLIRF